VGVELFAFFAGNMMFVPNDVDWIGHRLWDSLAVAVGV
jgi:hypothetical protein